MLNVGSTNAPGDAVVDTEFSPMKFSSNTLGSCSIFQYGNVTAGSRTCNARSNESR